MRRTIAQLDARTTEGVRLAARVLLALALCGLFLGAAARLVMATLAGLEGVGPGFSLGGTLEVVATGLIIGVPAGVALFVARIRIWRSSRILGAAAGAVLFLALAAFPPPAARSAAGGLSSRVLAAGFVLFAITFVAWGMLVQLAIDRTLIRRSVREVRGRIAEDQQG